MKELLKGFNQGLVAASCLAKKKKKRDKETGRRESGKHQLPGEIQTTHTVERVGKGGDRIEIRLNNVDQIVHC